MADEQRSATDGVVPSVYPNGYRFSEELLAKWVAIPNDALLTIGPLTRADIDQLLFSTADIARAIADLRNAVLLLSHGNFEGANVSLQNSQNATIDGETRKRLFFKAIIESILKARNAI
jgi:hypothetical protein